MNLIQTKTFASTETTCIKKIKTTAFNLSQFCKRGKSTVVTQILLNILLTKAKLDFYGMAKFRQTKREILYLLYQWNKFTSIENCKLLGTLFTFVLRLNLLISRYFSLLF